MAYRHEREAAAGAGELAGRRAWSATDGGRHDIHVGDERHAPVAPDHHAVGAALHQHACHVGKRRYRGTEDDAPVHDVAHHVGGQRADAEGRARRRRADDPREARLMTGQDGDDIEARKDTTDTAVGVIADEHVPFLCVDHADRRGEQRVARGHRWCLRREDLLGGRRATSAARTTSRAVIRRGAPGSTTTEWTW